MQNMPELEALDLARWVHDEAKAAATYLFGSRARGDWRRDSDVDILVLTEQDMDNEWLDNLEDKARRAQKDYLSKTGGINIVTMTTEGFRRNRRLINNLAWTIHQEGIPTMGRESLDYGGHESRDDYRPSGGAEEEGTDYEDEDLGEAVDWRDVENRIRDASNYANDLSVDLLAGILEQKSDKTFGNTAQQALENGYKALLGANGIAYPTSGRDGHNLRILIEKIKSETDWPSDEPVPGENHRYLSDFGGAQRYADEHMPLDKRRIAVEIPDAVMQLQQLVRQQETAKNRDS